MVEVKKWTAVVNQWTAVVSRWSVVSEDQRPGGSISDSAKFSTCQQSVTGSLTTFGASSPELHRHDIAPNKRRGTENPP
ncbi:hypothetical protein PoB_006888600 [Plakobranchus ocellatus]|uniref:Uncharacterized protein n=1 Tax=Plakobranchus ocellatus TaxID=259542 RepID=A0AAV4DE34_9GAST|nr:hypothetical protein PoB_006888600 [Plakobranchus ocellatus]